MEYEIDLDPARLDIARVHQLLTATYWSPGIRREVTEEAIRNSLNVAAYEVGTGTVVGFARVVTDYATFAWLCDVIVEEEHRGRGIATAMLKALEAHPRLQTLRRWFLATRDAQPLYERLGWEHVSPGRVMQKRMPPEAWSDTPDQFEWRR